MKTTCALLCLLAIIAGASQADAQTLYGATSGGHGELYTIDPATGGVIKDIGPLNDSSAVNYSVTGLAFHPVTGVLYGSTGGASGTNLLTIDPSSGLVTVVGSFNAGKGDTMTDLAFDSSGNLYGISSTGGPNLYTIDLGTGLATKVGAAGPTFTEGGGLAISSDGTFYGAPIPGDFGTYNPTNGLYTQIGAPTYPAGGGSYAALAFNGSVLFGVNQVPGNGGGVTHLVTIDPPTATVTDIGASVTHMDAIAFQPAPAAPTLTIQQTANGVIVGWPASATGFRLQENTDLTTTNWVDNNAATNVVSGTNQVTIAPATGNGFFRLINP